MSKKQITALIIVIGVIALFAIGALIYKNIARTSISYRDRQYLPSTKSSMTLDEIKTELRGDIVAANKSARGTSIFIPKESDGSSYVPTVIWLKKANDEYVSYELSGGP